MKVLFYESRPEWGGAQKCELQLLDGLNKLQFETIFVTSTNGPMLERVQSMNKKVHFFPIHSKINQIRVEHIKKGLMPLFAQTIYMIPHFLKVIGFILKEKPDIIYTSQMRSQLLIGWIGKMLRKKVIWHIHGEEKLDNFIGKLALYTSDQRVVVSKNINEMYKRQFPKFKDSFTFIPNGVMIKEKRQSKKSDVIHLLTLGALIEEKRQDLSIKACRLLLDQGYKIHLHIVGEKPPWHTDEYKNELIQLVTEKNLEQNVTFHGWVENPSKLLSEADIFLLPSDTEGLPLSIIEAMGVGLPCVATDVGGISELIAHKENGFIIPRDSLEELVSAIREIVEHVDLREKMGKASIKRYEKYFTEKAFLEGVAGVLHTVQR